MKSKQSSLTVFEESRFQNTKISLAVLFLVTLGSFVLAALSTSEGSVGDTVTTGFLWMYLSTSVVLPLLILIHAGYNLVNWVRGSSGTASQSIQRLNSSSVLRTVEVGIAVVILLGDGFLGYLFLTQPGGEGAGAIGIGGGLFLTLAGSCLAVTVLVDGIFGDTQSYIG